MSLEIERKYLVENNDWLQQVDESFNIRQGYIDSNGATVRVRITDRHAYLTIKGKRQNISRLEYEYEVPREDAEDMLKQLCRGGIVEKKRHKVYHDNDLWVVDVFSGDNKGLVLAEIELQSEEQVYKIPAWIGDDVSDVTCYRNSQLSLNPKKSW